MKMKIKLQNLIFISVKAHAAKPRYAGAKMPLKGAVLARYAGAKMPLKGAILAWYAGAKMPLKGALCRS
jgi:hypothetical protein